MENSAKAPVAQAAAPARSAWAWTVATVLGVGRLKPGPGTWASALAVAAWWAVAQVVPAVWHGAALVAMALAAVLIGIPASGIVARESGKDDPGVVVVDEVAGQWIALVAVPLNWKYLLLGLILFRIFDIWKPPPLRQIETWRGGAGIVLDDVAAGIYTRVTLGLMVYAGLLT